MCTYKGKWKWATRGERERNKGNCVCVSMNACIIRTSVDASDHQFVIQCREWERMKEREREKKRGRKRDRYTYIRFSLAYSEL